MEERQSEAGDQWKRVKWKWGLKKERQTEEGSNGWNQLETYLKILGAGEKHRPIFIAPL